jgi:hypothetical protein
LPSYRLTKNDSPYRCRLASQDIDNRIQWRKGVLLKNPSFNSQAVVRVNYQDRLLTIVVKGEQKRDYFAVIRKALQDIHASFEWKKTAG